MEKVARKDVLAIAAANRNTSGTDCCLTIQTTTAKEYLWTGSCFLPAVFADVILVSLKLVKFTQ
ncbi:hypothetical protein NQ314_013663 [Rhamnusium bicolor]|uniref:Uncharacterized protein n=1 Tax=Rhamnusium bicolor TaxID=1586634 RepID=A0AAV8X5X3_9CUCU|nr:hypothetical protein NQ314_013663 [Rhamnusium bicolor]